MTPAMPKLKKHNSPKSIWRRYLKPMMGKLETRDPRDIKYDEMDYDSVIARILTAGFWGFYDTNNQTIHYWHDGERSIADMIGFFAHELQHHVDDHWPTTKHKDKAADEEERADVTCDIARIAYSLAFECCKVRELIQAAKTKGDK